MMRRWSGKPPPWWPEGEPWPPRRGPFGSRGRLFRRIAFFGFVVPTVAFWLMAGAGWRFSHAWAYSNGGFFAIVATLVTVAMGFALSRLGSGLGEVMDAADRVADGDYRAEVREAGPPPIRALAQSFNRMTSRLRDSDRVRRDLMADVAHELRTPLAVLQGRLEGIMDGVYPRDDRQIGILLDETRVLSRLIEDLRTLALSDAGALPLHLEPTDLGSLVDDVVRSMEAEAARASVTLTVDSPSEPDAIDLDPLRIREVLMNLVSNALRHTPSGGAVSIAVRSTAEHVSISVSDNGAGMSPEAAARAFGRFHKGESSRGSGLGLAIAKGIVEAHRGTIALSSQLGTGTVVTFTLPRRSIHQRPRPESPFIQ